MKEVVIYKTRFGKEPFKRWLKGLGDSKVRAAILSRLDQLVAGFYGDYKMIDRGLFELRLHQGPGYRIYFTEKHNHLVILLAGGLKRSQKSDIKKAKKYLLNIKESGQW